MCASVFTLLYRYANVCVDVLWPQFGYTCCLLNGINFHNVLFKENIDQWRGRPEPHGGHGQCCDAVNAVDVMWIKISKTLIVLSF